MYIGCTSFANFLSKQGTLFSKSPIPEYYINQFYHSLNPALLNSLSLPYDHALIYIIKYHAIIYIMKYPLLNKNKRPMGHIAHLRNQFKSINTYDYIITLIKRRRKNIHFMITYCFFHLNPHPRMLCAKIGWNQWFWRRVFFLISSMFSLIWL